MKKLSHAVNYNNNIKQCGKKSSRRLFKVDFMKFTDMGNAECVTLLSHDYFKRSRHGVQITGRSRMPCIQHIKIYCLTHEHLLQLGIYKPSFGSYEV